MLQLETRGDVTILTLDHGPVNAMDVELLDGIASTLGSIPGALVVTGRGSSLSAGVDLRRILADGPAYTARLIPALSRAFLAVFNHPSPVVAAINGHAVAGGCVLAMACDVRIMSAGRIGIVESAVGVPFPTAAIEICRYALGPATGAAALRAEAIEPPAAKAAGMVDEVVEPAVLLDRAVELAAQLGAYSPAAYELTKRQLHRPVLERIERYAAVDDEVLAGWTSTESVSRIGELVASLSSRRA